MPYVTYSQGWAISPKKKKKKLYLQFKSIVGHIVGHIDCDPFGYVLYVFFKQF